MLYLEAEIKLLNIQFEKFDVSNKESLNLSPDTSEPSSKLGFSWLIGIPFIISLSLGL